MADTVIMKRELKRAPSSVLLPRQFSVTSYSLGDEEAWYQVQTAADSFNTITPSLFFEQFGNDLNLLASRLHFVWCENEVVGTVAAWFGGHGHAEQVGRLHWLAVVPKYQRQGVGDYLVGKTLEQFYGCGYKEVYLTTSKQRPGAIALYEKWGFQICA